MSLLRLGYLNIKGIICIYANEGKQPPSEPKEQKETKITKTQAVAELARSENTKTSALTLLICINLHKHVTRMRLGQMGTNWSQILKFNFNEPLNVMYFVPSIVDTFINK